MLEWVDRDTFKLKGKTCIYNYNNIISIGVYTYKDENKTKLMMRTCTGEKLILYECDCGETDKVKKLEESFNKFMNSRPGNTSPNKVKIK